MTIQPTELAASSTALPPPRTRGLPLIGALPAFLRQPFAFLRHARAAYGDIYTLDLGVVRWVILNHPRHADHVLRHHSHNYAKGGAFWTEARKLLGNGLVVSEGDFWLRQRRMIQPHFHHKALAGLTEAMVTAITESLHPWDAAARREQPLDVLPACSTITMRVIARALFGQGLQADEIARASELLTVVLEYLLVGAATASLPPWVPIPGKRRFRRAIRELDALILRIIAAERRRDTPSATLLAMLVHQLDADTGERMTDAQVRDEVITFVLAGYETTSLALTWALDVLTHRPDILKRVQAEVDATLNGAVPTFATLAQLSYTRRVIQETLRLRPPSWWLPRTALHDDVIDGYAIPAGTTVVSLAYGIHHHPQIWPDPDRFDPERFTPEQDAQRHKLAWVPFGAGQRQCIGRDFALLEAQVVLAMLVQRYRLTAVAKHAAQPRLSATLRPKTSVQVQVARRYGQ